MKVKNITWEKEEYIERWNGFCGDKNPIVLLYNYRSGYWDLTLHYPDLDQSRESYKHINKAKKMAEAAFRESITAKYNELKHFIEE